MNSSAIKTKIVQMLVFLGIVLSLLFSAGAPSDFIDSAKPTPTPLSVQAGI
jgi:hypothetical protein